MRDPICILRATDSGQGVYFHLARKPCSHCSCSSASGSTTQRKIVSHSFPCRSCACNRAMNCAGTEMVLVLAGREAAGCCRHDLAFGLFCDIVRTRREGSGAWLLVRPVAFCCLCVHTRVVSVPCETASSFPTFTCPLESWKNL